VRREREELSPPHILTFSPRLFGKSMHFRTLLALRKHAYVSGACEYVRRQDGH